MKAPSIAEIDIKDKKVLVRVDFDVPVTRSGEVSDVSKILRALPTIRYATGQKARVILASHRSGPEGRLNRRFSLEPVGRKLSDLLDCEIYFPENSVGDAVKKIAGDMLAGSVMLLENLEFHRGECANSPDFARKLAEVADIYVNEAFAISHQERASVLAVTDCFDTVCAGLAFKNEIDSLCRYENPERPFTVIVGGECSYQKFELMDSLLDRADTFLIGGAVANSFFRVLGKETGRSAIDTGTLYSAKKFISGAATRNIKLVIPDDLVTVRGDLKPDSASYIISGGHIPKDSTAVDIGPETRLQFAKDISRARTVLWNGPLGMYETSDFGEGTSAVAKALTESEAFTGIIGEDTVSAIEACGLDAGLSFVSGGGAAAVEFIKNGTLPAVTALERRTK